MSLEASLDALQRIVENSAFLRPFGLEVRACAAGECTLVLPHAAWLERPGGVLSGISLMAVADVAMWLAIMTRRGTEENWVTTDMKTAFLSGARAVDVSCVARVLKLGKRTAYGTAECHGADGTLLTHHVLSYALTVPA